MVENITYLLSILTVVGQVLVLVLVFEFLRTRRGALSPILRVIKKNAILFAFFVAGIATLGSLFFSEIALYEPCKFCWLQRIFMYPLVIIFGLALSKGARDSSLYGFALSVIGIFIATYHYLMQIEVIAPTTCSAVGFAASCADSFALTFGYITIPMMALTAFLLITIITFFSRYYD